MAKTSASFTLMDYTDGISLITGIDSNLPLTQLYNPNATDGSNKLSPSWGSPTSLILTPKVLKAGSSTSLVSSMTNIGWGRRFAGAEKFTPVVSGENNESINSSTGELTVSANKLTDSNWQMDYKFSGTYTDPILNLAFPVEITITLSRVANGTSFVVARAYAPNGNQFKNNQPENLTVKAELIRGTGTDTSDLTYTWQKYNTSTAKWDNISGSTTDTLTINAEDVVSFAMYRCQIKDTDASSDTSGDTFTTEGVAFYDVTDPYQAVIESTAGNVFKKNSSASTTNTILICRVYQNGEEVDTTGENLTYTWTQTDKDGNAVSDFDIRAVAVESEGIVATKKKAIKVISTDVNVKATFFCEVN